VHVDTARHVFLLLHGFAAQSCCFERRHSIRIVGVLSMMTRSPRMEHILRRELSALLSYLLGTLSYDISGCNKENSLKFHAPSSGPRALAVFSLTKRSCGAVATRSRHVAMHPVMRSSYAKFRSSPELQVLYIDFSDVLRASFASRNISSLAPFCAVFRLFQLETSETVVISHRNIFGEPALFMRSVLLPSISLSLRRRVCGCAQLVVLAPCVGFSLRNVGNST
jgi:hypothetical protein